MMQGFDMTDAIISITGIQHNLDGKQDEVKLVTAGRYGYLDGHSRFTYEESALTGLRSTETTFTISPMGVVLRRVGNVTSEMIFQQGKKNFILCDTPFGNAALGVDTHRIKTDLNEHGGDMEIDYEVEVNNTPVGRNHFKINVKENTNKYGRSC